MKHLEELDLVELDDEDLTALAQLTSLRVDLLTRRPGTEGAAALVQLTSLTSLSVWG